MCQVALIYSVVYIFCILDEVKIAIDEAMSYAKMNKGKEPIFRRAIAELLTTTASVSSTWRKYKV